jgi:hypothetical protein
MGAPTHETHGKRSTLRLPILGGLVAAPAAAGSAFTFSVAVTVSGVLLGVELTEYLPRGARLRIVRWLYRWAQEPLHALIGRRFLRRADRGLGATVPALAR